MSSNNGYCTDCVSWVFAWTNDTRITNEMNIIDFTHTDPFSKYTGAANSQLIGTVKTMDI